VLKKRASSRSRDQSAYWRDRGIYPPSFSSQEELRVMRAYTRRRRRTWLIRTSLIVAPLLVGLFVAGFLIRADRGSGGDPGTAGASASHPAQADTGVPSARYVNEDGGYAFRPPAGWNVTRDGTRTELADPTGDVDMWMDIAADGETDEVLAALLPSLTFTWFLLHTEAPIIRQVGRQPAVSAGGTGVADGIAIRFLAIVVDGGDRNYTIFVSVPQAQDPVTVTPQIEAALSSFELLPRG
jgi:hypothetical protein